MSYDLSLCINYCRPNSAYSHNGEYSSLNWYESNSTTKPTEEEITSAWNTIQSEKPLNLLRIQRNNLLINSDKYGLKDFPHSSETKRQEWFTYRQVLRDITTTQTPQIDEYGNLTNITWPTPPS